MPKGLKSKLHDSFSISGRVLNLFEFHCRQHDTSLCKLWLVTFHLGPDPHFLLGSKCQPKFLQVLITYMFLTADCQNAEIFPQKSIVTTATENSVEGILRREKENVYFYKLRGIKVL